MTNKDKGLIGNEVIENSINALSMDFSEENLAVTLSSIRQRMNDGGQFVVGVDAGGNTLGGNIALKTVKYEGKKWFIVFTGFEEELKGDTRVMSGFLADIDQILNMALNSEEIEGIIINPYSQMLSLNKKIIKVITG